MSTSKEIALMFSGGVDSTIAAVELAKTYDKVHLYNYKNGYGHYAMGRSRKRYEELDRLQPGRFTFTYRPIRELFERITVRTLAEDYREFGSAFVWCMGCKLAMHTMSIVLSLERGVRVMSDGSASDSDEMVEQMLISISMVRLFYKEFGIDFEIPVYEIPRDDKRRILGELGIRMGIPIRDRYLGIQPSCIPGELYYLPYVLFNKSPGHLESVVARFIDAKKAVARAYVEEHFRAQGRDLDTLLAERADRG